MVAQMSECNACLENASYHADRDHMKTQRCVLLVSLYSRQDHFMGPRDFGILQCGASAPIYARVSVIDNVTGNKQE